jgi:hypothetical protein
VKRTTEGGGRKSRMGKKRGIGGSSDSFTHQP